VITMVATLVGGLIAAALPALAEPQPLANDSLTILRARGERRPPLSARPTKKQPTRESQGAGKPATNS
jgi:hypothetical protein